MAPHAHVQPARRPHTVPAPPQSHGLRFQPSTITICCSARRSRARHRHDVRRSLSPTSCARPCLCRKRLRARLRPAHPLLHHPRSRPYVRACPHRARARARSAGRLQTCCARRPSMVASACERDEHCPRPLLHVAPTHRPLHRRRCALASQCAITTTSTARSLPSLGLAASSSFPPRACGLSWRRACGYETDTLPPPHCADPHRTRACTPRSPAWCLRALSLSDCTCWQLGEMTP